MNGRALSYAIALGAGAAVLHVGWRVATSPLTVLLASGFVATRLLGRTPEPEPVPATALASGAGKAPSRAWVQAFEGLKAAYLRGSQRERRPRRGGDGASPERA